MKNRALKKYISSIKHLSINKLSNTYHLIDKDFFIITKVLTLFNKMNLFKKIFDILEKPFISSSKIVSIKLLGGLGNQLFQIATTLAYAWKHSLNPQYKKAKKIPSRLGYRPGYWNTVFRKLPIKNYLPYHLIVFKENSFSYHKIPGPNQIENFEKHNGILFYGYFQSAKYFDKYRKKILSFLFYIDSSEKNYLKKKYSVIFSEKKITVSLHIRREDNIKEPVPLVTPYLWNTDYYQKSIAYFKNKFGTENLKIVVISDDPLWSKEFMKKTFPELKPLYPHEKDYLDLYLMSCCRHQIISNSSFSWWAAYLNTYLDKIIVAPKKWFGPKGPLKWDDIYIDEWITF